jgi:hypothetical protein
VLYFVFENIMLFCRRLVIDEADTMFDQGFGEDVTKLLDILKKKQPPVQVGAAALWQLAGWVIQLQGVDHVI